MREDDLTRADVVGFSCGAEPWAREIAEILSSGRAWRELHHLPGQVTLLYCHDLGTGEVIGFANVVRVDRVITLGESRERLPSLHLTYFGVGEHHQGRGHAKRMLAGIEDQARQASLRAIDLYVHERNHPAITLYLGRGYDYVEGARRIRADYGGDYVRMMKLLTDQEETP
jgi:GNAT superfamily N-acetyltransferase